jgi:prepilin-type N-terminal cleavage/methylation domain-containing protein
MRDTRYENGFTFVELLVALIVASIIFAAVATLAYSLGAVNDATNDMAEKQAQVRYATLRISELIRHCKLVCAKPGNNDIVIWKADDTDINSIDVNEVVYIEYEEPNVYMREFCTVGNPTVLGALGLDDTQPVLTILGNSETKNNLTGKFGTEEVRRTCLLSNCMGVDFDLHTLPPYSNSRFVSISFGLVENGVTRQYQISAALRGWAGNLLDESGAFSSYGDDD